MTYRVPECPRCEAKQVVIDELEGEVTGLRSELAVRSLAHHATEPYDRVARRAAMIRMGYWDRMRIVWGAFIGLVTLAGVLLLPRREYVPAEEWQRRFFITAAAAVVGLLIQLLVHYFLLAP